MSRGIVYLVGAGPGDPGLLTIRGRELLQSCDAVVYDALVSDALLAATVGERDVERYFVGKRGGDTTSARQNEIEMLLVRLAREGKRVVRLKGGDPFVFGRGGEEAQALAHAAVPFEIVPGVTAGIAAPAYAGIPVTQRGLATAVTLVTGHEDPEKGERSTDWRALAQSGATLVLYMGVRTLPDVVRELVAGGRAADTPAAMVERGTLPGQRVVTATLETIAERAREAGVSAPAITIVGDVVSVRDQIAWWERRPLAGKRILVTRARAQASVFAARLRDLGADVIEMPAIRIEPVDPAPLDEALRALGEYDWVVFASQNAVEVVWRAIRGRGLDARAFGRVRIAAIGRVTADALLDRGLAADVVPEQFVAEALVQALQGRDDIEGRRVLLPGPTDAREVLPEGLRNMGARVDVVPVYRTVLDGEGAARVADQLRRGDVDLVTLTSSSTARFFVEAIGADLARPVRAASIGPITSATARALGLHVVIESGTSTIDGLVDAIVASTR